MASRIHQVVKFPASTDQIYANPLDAEQFSNLTVAPAVFDRGPGGEFSFFGGQIVGRKLELIASELIVQAWRDGSWRRGEFSCALRTRERTMGFALTCDQLGILDKAFDELDTGWHQLNWEPIRRAW